MTTWSFLKLLGHALNRKDRKTAPSPGEHLPRKEREKLTRQHDILAAARELFVAKGYHETTLEEIARHAEFGKGTIYNYFASKEELFFGIIEEVANDTIALARSSMLAPGGIRDKLLLYARDLMTYVKINGPLLHIVYHELHRLEDPSSAAKLRQIVHRARDAWEVIAEPLADGIREKTIRHADPLKLAMLFDGMLRGYCFHQFALPHARSEEDIPASAEFITSVFFDGISERKSKG
jgi:AcrR family transcriptional regulator